MRNNEKLIKLAKELREAKIDFSDARGGQIDLKNEKILIAGKMKAYRLIYKLTQEELAKKINVAKLQIIRWEGGKNMPSKMALEKLKAAGII